MNTMSQRATEYHTMLRKIFMFTVSLFLSAATLFARQGAVRALYTVPNTTFIEQPTGDSVVTINDTSGSISSLQTAINNAGSANPGSIIVIHLLRGAIYSVSSAGLVLSSNECLVAEGAIIQPANSSVTVPLITISSGSTNVSVSGGTLDGQNANIQGIFAPSAARVNIDKVVLKNFGSDAIFLNGKGNTTFDNEMAVTRADVSASAVGIHIQNSTQSTLLDNNCHDNGTGILVSAAWANIANNTCHNNTTGIDIAGGDDNIVSNNTCNNNSTGIHAGATKNMIVSNSMGGNTTAGISSDGTSNNFIDNLFTAGNATNFVSSGSSNNIIAYKAPISASGQNYFYPPLIDNQHTDPTIVTGMGRTDLTISSTTIDDVQNQYNAARSANPNNVIVLHLNGTFTVGVSPLLLSSNTSVLLNGTIQINSSTTATAAIATSASGQTRISISGGTLDGGNLESHTGVLAISGSMIQVDGMTIQNLGDNSSHHSGSDSIHFSGGTTPYVVTRCTINKSGARGIWSQLSGQKALYADNSVVLTRACIDADSHTFGSVMMFNFCDSNTYGIFIEQGAAHNTAIGNVSNNSARHDIEVFNNNDTPPVEFNSIISNSVTNTVSGGSGIHDGSTGTTVSSFTSDNFFFNNTVSNANIQSTQQGSQNYYAQNYLAGGTLSTSGTETFFNSADVSGNLQIRDSNSGLTLVVAGASSTDGASVVTAQPSALGDVSNDDEWQFVPTSNGYYKVVNANSGLVMAVQGASSASGASVIQTAYTADSTFNDEWLMQPTDTGLYNFVSRSSGLYLDVSGAGTTPGTQLIQFPSNGGANQQFSLLEDAPASVIPDFTLSASPASQSVVAGNRTSYTATVTASNGFTGTVSLSVSGLPAGATCSAPSISGGSGSSTVSCSTTVSTPPGTYTLTITGTSGTLSHPSSVTLVVTAPPDFSIAATPASQSLLPGGSASYTASISPLNGYAGTVSFTASGLPAGATVSFSPASVSGGSGSSTMTVSTASTTAAGNYTITITGADSSANLAHSTTVTLAVMDFSLTATPSSQTVTATGSTSYTACVNPLNGFTGTVNLSVRGLPAGATASLNPASVSGSGSSTLTVSTSCSTPTGTYTLTITGTSGSLSHSASVTLVVNAAASDFTIAASPASNTVTAGSGVNYTVNVGATGCFVGTANLSLSGLPSGATATLNPTSINGSGNSTLSVSTSSTASTGTFTLTIAGASGSLSHSATVTLTINPASSGLPSGWSDTDVGSPAIAGSASFSNGVFTVNGSGADIYGTSDQFNYASQSQSGDISITARVASQQNTNVWAKSGVMIRETTAANSSFVHVFITPGHGVNMQYRNGTGTSAVQLAQTTGPVVPYWVRLVRTGSIFTGFASADGVTWTQVGTISVTMASNVHVGLAVTSHNTAALNTSTFDNVNIATTATLAPAADAYVRDGTSAGTNFGADTTLAVKNSTTGFNRHAFLKFDLSAVSTVSAAKLRLFGSFGATSGMSPVTAHQVADTSWTETGITWNNQPAIGTTMTTVSVGITAQYWEWDLTSYIQSQKAAGKTSVTLELQNDVGTAQPANFNSREAASNPPQLVVSP